MDNFNYQVMHGLSVLLTSKYVSFILDHSLLLGFISGVLSLIPFAIKRILHIIVLVIAVLIACYLVEVTGLKLGELFYSNKAFIIANLIGNYFFGCIAGFVIANTIQRIRGEHDHVTNN